MKKIILLVCFFTLMAIGMAHAASLTLGTTTWGNNSLVNITLGTPASCTVYCGNATKYVTVFAACSDTANSSVSKIVNITNGTATNFNAGYANFTFGKSIVLEDSAVCSITGITTGTGNGDGVLLAATTVLVDRNSPSKPTTTQAQGSKVETGDIINYTVTGSTTTACYIQFLASSGSPSFSGTSTYSMTHTGNSCAYTIPASLADLSYEVYARASDGTNKTNSDKLMLIVDSVDGGTGDSGVDTITTDLGKNAQKNNLKNVVIVLGIIFVLYVLLNNKK